MACRIDWVMRRVKEEEKRGGDHKGKETSKNPRAEPREHIGKMAESYRKEKLGGEKRSSGAGEVLASGWGKKF